MTTDELRAAADRLRRHRAGEPFEAVWPDEGSPGPDGKLLYEADLERLADAYLAEHSADDGEPADSTWAGERGFEWSSDGESMYRKCGPLEVVLSGDIPTCEKQRHLAVFWRYPHSTPKISQYYGLLDDPTCGDVRRLCAALGEPLKEPSRG